MNEHQVKNYPSGRFFTRFSNEICSPPTDIFTLARPDLQGNASGHAGAPGSGPVSKGIFLDEPKPLEVHERVGLVYHPGDQKGTGSPTH